MKRLVLKRIAVSLFAGLVASVVAWIAQPSAWPKPAWDHTHSASVPADFLVAVLASDGKTVEVQKLAVRAEQKLADAEQMKLATAKFPIATWPVGSENAGFERGLSVKAHARGIECSLRYGKPDFFSRYEYVVTNGTVEPLRTTNVRGPQVAFKEFGKVVLSAGVGLIVLCLAFVILRWKKL
jgi:hypothetical protein